MSEPTKEALELAKVRAQLKTLTKDFRHQCDLTSSANREAARLTAERKIRLQVKAKWSEKEAEIASLREELRAAREALIERDAAFLYIRTLWRNNQLPAAMDNYLFNALTKKSEAQP